MSGYRSGQSVPGWMGLQLRGLVWESAGRYRLDVDPLVVGRGAVVAVVVTEPYAAGALADAVLGLAAPVAGSVLVDGVDVVGRPPDPGRIALVPVGGGLLPHLDVGRNIEIGLSGSGRSRRPQLREVLRQFRLDGALNHLPRRLSPEQQIRVAAARALASHPVAVVVEDRDGEASCGSAIQAAREQNVAVLMLTNAALRAAEITAQVHGVSAETTADPEPSGTPPDGRADAGPAEE